MVLMSACSTQTVDDFGADGTRLVAKISCEVA